MTYCINTSCKLRGTCATNFYTILSYIVLDSAVRMVDYDEEECCYFAELHLNKQSD